MFGSEGEDVREKMRVRSREGIEENNESDNVGVKESVVRSMIQTEKNKSDVGSNMTGMTSHSNKLST